MTTELNELITRIRTLKIMFSVAEYDTIPSEAESLIRDMQSKVIDSIHSAAIIPPGSRGMWRTTVYVTKGGKKKRKDICAKTQDALLKKLYDYYVGPGTLDQIHALWAEQREHENLASSTVQRERQRWDKYIGGTDLVKKRIDEIDNFLIEEYLRKIIKENSITTKELREIMFLLRKTFNYAFRHRLIPSNPMSVVEVNTSGCAPVTPKYSKSRVFLSDEITAIQDEIAEEIRSIPYNTTALAVSLLFVLGLRIGELVALRESDIDWTDRTIHIQRMEQRRDKEEPLLVNHTKKKSPWGNRIIPLGKSGAEIIQQVMEINRQYGFWDEDFLFLGETGKRIHIRAVDNRIRKLCKRAGIEPAKSAHDIRRTVATRLYRNTHDIELVRKFLGHSDVQTTWGYIVDIDAEEEDHRRVAAALEGMIRPRATSASSGTPRNIIDFIPGKNRHGSRITVPMEKVDSKCKLTACHTQVTHFSEA